MVWAVRDKLWIRRDLLRLEVLLGYFVLRRVSVRLWTKVLFCHVTRKAHDVGEYTIENTFVGQLGSDQPMRTQTTRIPLTKWCSAFPPRNIDPVGERQHSIEEH